jgi:putative ABC transport system permease protein
VLNSALESLRDDVRQAARGLVRTPGYSIMAVLALAIGIGATAAAYSIVAGVLLAPLPFAEADRLVSVWSSASGCDHCLMSYPDFEDYHSAADVFDGFAFVTGHGVTITRPEGNVAALAAMVTPDFFPLLRATPVLGRTLRADDDHPGAAPVTVLSHALWVNHFGGDPRVIGETVEVESHPFTIVGVLAAGQSLPEWVPGVHSDLFVPLYSVPALQLPALHSRDSHSDSRTIARLKPRVTLAQARERLRPIAARLAAAYPKSDSGVRADVTPLRDTVIGDARPALGVLGAAVLLVFLLACADVANLALLRATARARELAVRAALGAGWARVARYLAVESALLALGGGLGGAALAIAGVRAFVAASPGDIPRADEIVVGGGTLLALAVAAVTATAVCTLAPIAIVGRADLVPALKSGGRGPSASRGTLRLRGGIVTAQFAVAMVLVVGAGLLIRSFAALRVADPGFDSSHLLIVNVRASRASGERMPEVQRVNATLTLPGVESIALVNHPPLSPGGTDTPVGLDGADPASDSVESGYMTVSPAYFSVMRIPMARGRQFTDADSVWPPQVAIVSRAAAQHYWPGGDPIGHRITVLDAAHGDPNFGKPMTVTVVGVAGDVRRYSRADPPARLVYLPADPASGGQFVVRTLGPPGALMPAIRHVLQPVDPAAVISVERYDDMAAAGTVRERFLMSLLGAFSMIAFVLAALGIYGVIAYTVSQRTAEMGIRVALGARARDIIALMIRRALVLAFTGIVLGIWGAWLLGRAMRGMLFGVTAFDPVTFAGVALLLGTTALAASYLPARRAARTDPLVALRAE